MLRRKISLFLIFTLLFVPTFVHGEVEIKSKAALLMDYNTGNVIYAKNEHDRLAPASITKIMTLLLTMEALSNGKIKLDDKVIISEYAASMGGTQLYLEAGEVQTVENLIKATAIRSANDAAVALGEFISGSNEGFVKLMNQRAKELGMENTNFSNSSGLPIDNHYTSAYDVALMSRELLRHNMIIPYLTTYMEDMVVGRKKNDTQTMVNTNRLIKDYDGATGIKTGSISSAGYCLSGSAKRGDLQLIAVIMGSDTSNQRFNEAKKLLDFGFANYDSITIGKKNDVIATLPIEKGKNTALDIVLERDAFALLPKGSKGKVEKSIEHKETVQPPVKYGDILGELIVTVDGKEIDRINLIARNDIERAGYFTLLKRTVKNFITGK